MSNTPDAPSLAPDPAAVCLENVSKFFDGERRSGVRGVSFTVGSGAFVSVVGSSGSGKTTILKIVNGLIRADEGCVVVGGQRVGSLPGYVLRRSIGYVFQGIGLFPHLTVGENIGITPKLLGWRKEVIAARVDELLDLIELPRDHAGKSPAALSGGQRQRVGLARALAARPRIMLMDEPFGALDPLTRDALGTEYRRVHEKLGLTTLMVTHDILEAVLLSDRILVMRAGQLVADDTPHALLRGHEDPAVRELMDVPRRQARSVRRLTDELGSSE